MTEKAIEEGLLVRAEFLERAEEISQRIVKGVRVEGSAFLLGPTPIGLGLTTPFMSRRA